MHRFAPALHRVARELDLPPGARASVLRELAGDLDAVYAHHRERGVGDEEARRRAEESVLGTTEVVRRLARLHRHSWRGWSESMAARLVRGIDLLMLGLGVVPMLAAAALLAFRAGGGVLTWATSLVGVAIGAVILIGATHALRRQALPSGLLESLLLCGAVAAMLGVLGGALALDALFAHLASGGPTAASAGIAARVAHTGSMLVLGLLLAIAALFTWFLLLGREAARMSAEVDALLGPDDIRTGPAHVIPLEPGRLA